MIILNGYLDAIAILIANLAMRFALSYYIALGCYIAYVLCTMSAKSPWNTHAVVGIFYPHPFFAAK